MVKITETYCDTLRKLAKKGDMFFLDPITLRFTMDQIGQTILCVHGPRNAPNRADSASETPRLEPSLEAILWLTAC